MAQVIVGALMALAGVLVSQLITSRLAREAREFTEREELRRKCEEIMDCVIEVGRWLAETKSIITIEDWIKLSLPFTLIKMEMYSSLYYPALAPSANDFVRKTMAYYSGMAECIRGEITKAQRSQLIDEWQRAKEVLLANLYSVSKRHFITKT